MLYSKVIAVCSQIHTKHINTLYRQNVELYRVIHKSFRDFRPLRYSSRDGHAQGERVNRGRDTPSFGPTLQVLDMLLSAVSVLVVEQPISEVREGLMNYPVYTISPH
jgi:hypothetical protein